MSEFKVGSDGSLTPLPAPTQGFTAPYLVQGSFLYAASAGGSISVFSIDEATGALTPVASSPFSLQSPFTALTRVTPPQPLP